METITTYLAMGGYAAFIWPAYGVAALILILFALDSWQRVKRAEIALRRLEADNSGNSGRRPAAATSQSADADQSAVQP